MQRAVLAKTLLVALFAGAAASASAQAVSALKNHDANAPVDFAADRIELQDRADRAVLTGNVDITQGDMRLRASRVTIAYTSANQTQVTRMDASGGVTLTSRTETARAQFGIYDLRSRLVTMIGGVVLSRPGQGETRGNRMVLNMNTGFATLDGGAVGGSGGGRVTGRFTPPPRATAAPGKN
ncbi:LptA/OstA family protein [Rhizorhabdus argentea]|uniref:LptA/OstA family protein n=1 Tax=Rhizorhabdus argentea TaxID=1387174 RepID=UPI0030EBFBDF